MLTYFIIGLTCIISYISFSNQPLFNQLLFNAYQIKKRNEWYRFVSHAFVHADFTHLLFNMFALFFFGPAVENYFSYYFSPLFAKIIYLLLYFGGTIAASIPSYNKNVNNVYYNSVGASGAVSAVVFASILFNPTSKICLYGILCFPGLLWGIAYLGYSYYMSKQKSDMINHDAHFAGAIFGVLFTIAAKPQVLMMFINQLKDYFS